MSASALRPAPSWPRWAWLLSFFVVCPIVLGMPLGWYQAGAAALLPNRSSGIVLWSFQWLISWWIAEALFQTARAGLRPWTTRIAPALVFASVGNALLASLYAAPYFDLVAMLAGSNARMPTLPAGRNLFDPAYLWMLAQATAPGALVWMGLRALFEHIAATAPPRVRDATATDQTTLDSPLLAAASAQGIGPEAIIAATAEDHYVRLHAADRSILLSYRFADAMADLAPLEGVRTHRSAWVRLAAVSGLERDGGRRQVALTSGLRVALSERHAGLIEFALAEREKSLAA